MLEGAKQDRQSIAADWTFTDQKLIAGVCIREVRHVPKDNGYLTEMFRRDWAIDDGVVDQVFSVFLQPGALSAWHSHVKTRDRLFVAGGQVRIVLFDSRPESPTHGTVNVLRFSEQRPALVVVPPLIWHGLKNLGSSSAMVLNFVDKAYSYDDPDHWRLPADTDKIPYTW